MKRSLYLCFFLCLQILALLSCEKDADSYIKRELKIEGVAKNLFSDSVIPNLKFSVIEVIHSFKNFQDVFTNVRLDSFKVDSTGHYHYESKVNNASDEFIFTCFNPEYSTNEIEVYPSQVSRDLSLVHFDLLLTPGGITSLTVKDSDLNKFDSIHIQYPGNPSKILSWRKIKSTPKNPIQKLYPQNFEIDVIKNRDYVLQWSYFKNGLVYAGKEISFRQNNFNGGLTLEF